MKMKMKFDELGKNYQNIFKGYKAPGLQKIIASDNLFFKIFWITFFLISFGLAFYFTTQAIIVYVHYDVIQKTEIINPNQIQFPTISLCSDAFDAKVSFRNYIDNCTFNLNNDCGINTDNNFNAFFSYSTGLNCFQFNSGKNISNQFIPIKNLTLIEKPNGFVLQFKQPILTTSSAPSIYIYIDDQESPSFINEINYKLADFVISPNYEYNIVLTKTVNERLGPPYHKCYINAANDFPLDKIIINYFQSNKVAYEQFNCHKLCGELEYINMNPCNCPLQTSLGNVLRDCAFNQNEILKKCTNDFLNDFIIKREDKCAQYCPSECNSIDYKFAAINSSSNLFQLFIYFDQLNYRHNFEIPAMLLIDLLSSIGGILSLFLSLGLVSLCECSHFTCKTCDVACRKPKVEELDEKKAILIEELKKQKNEIVKEIVHVVRRKIDEKAETEAEASLAAINKPKFDVRRKFMEAKMKINLMNLMKRSMLNKLKIINETDQVKRESLKKKTSKMFNEYREYFEASRYMDWYHKNKSTSDTKSNDKETKKTSFKQF